MMIPNKFQLYKGRNDFKMLQKQPKKDRRNINACKSDLSTSLILKMHRKSANALADKH